MGGGGKSYVDVGPDAVYRTLRNHPNFTFPEPPELPHIYSGSMAEDVARYVVETIAAYVSPPKVDGEDDEMACVDVAGSLRQHLLPEILSKLRERERSIKVTPRVEPLK